MWKRRALDWIHLAGTARRELEADAPLAVNGAGTDVNWSVFWSMPEVKTDLLSGATARQRTSAAWAEKATICVLVCASQKRTWPSESPETIVPSLEATGGEASS